MASLLQYRAICRDVQSKIDALKDSEKGQSPARKNSERTLNDNETRGATGEGQNENDAYQSHDAKDSNDSNSDSDQKEYWTRLPGIKLEPYPESAGPEKQGKKYLQVNFWDENDPFNPQNWPERSKWVGTFMVVLIGFVCTCASSIDSAVAVPAAEALGVSAVVESMSTAMYLIAFGVGSLFAGPGSELFGRLVIYVAALAVLCIFLMASALSPNIGAQLAFRFLAGLSASAPLVCSGGSIADMWNVMDKTLAFPVFAITGFGGPVLGPVISAWIPGSVLSWRWAEWVMLIMTGLVLFIVSLLMKETFAPMILRWRARCLRQRTGDDRFQTAMIASQRSQAVEAGKTFLRPAIFALEPIVLVFTLYLAIIYIILFTFLDGYTVIFQETYGVSSGISYTIFVALFVGILSIAPIVPPIYFWTKKHYEEEKEKHGDKATIKPEMRLIFAMIGAPLVPISLFWLAWTDYAFISIWSPIFATGLFGFAVVNIFISAYMYIIDSYLTLSASALTYVGLIRYLAAGGMTIVGVPMYDNLGSHVTGSILGGIAAVMVPTPYLLWIYGERLRKRSEHAVHETD